ncbi:MAG: type VI secretion system baseplate subunit TssF [Nannocystaceae bacterium]|nr:type VI secretion system baseplate subunit TssF [bacterium]
MKARYYESELAYLREQGRALAKKHPRTAGLLAERSDDPDVERLLEGVAFLTAAIRERIDDAVPELAAAYAGMLVPALARFVPPTSVVEYRPEVQGLRVPELVPRGTQLTGTGGSGVESRFQTTAPVLLLPLTLEGIEHRKPLEGVDELVLSMRGAEQKDAAVGEHPVRFFFQGDPQLWTGLRTWFLRHCEDIGLYVDDERKATLPVESIRGVGHGDDVSLMPAQSLEHDGFSRIAEFFSCPAKFAFIDLPALGPDARGEFQLRCRFSGAPKLPKTVTQGDIRLHCTPVINLFEIDLEPVRVDVYNPWQLLRVARHRNNHSEVWAVTEVLGLGPELQVEFNDFSSAGSAEKDVSSYFVTKREAAPNGAGTQRFISLVSTLDRKPPLGVEVLSMRGLCSNRALACELGIGQLCDPVRGAGSSVPFSNIKPVSPPLYPHDNAELLWQLGAHLSLSRKDILDAASLRSVLRAYNFAAGSNPSLDRINGRSIESIREVRVQTCVRLIAGAPVTGTRTTVVVDAKSFALVSEAYVLGEMLDDLFARRVGLNSFNIMSLEVAPSGARYTWKPRNATRELR